MAVDRFVSIFGLTSNSLNIHEPTAADPLDLGSTSLILRIIERQGAREILVAALTVFLSYFCSTRHLYTDYGDTIMCDQG